MIAAGEDASHLFIGGGGDVTWGSRTLLFPSGSPLSLSFHSPFLSRDCSFGNVLSHSRTPAHSRVYLGRVLPHFPLFRLRFVVESRSHFVARIFLSPIVYPSFDVFCFSFVRSLCVLEDFRGETDVCVYMCTNTRTSGVFLCHFVVYRVVSFL